MKKMIAGLAVGIILATGSAVNADCVNCDKSEVNVSVNGNHYFGKWAMVDDRPFISLEGLSNALNLPRKHNYKSWNLGGRQMTGDPLTLMAEAGGNKLKPIRFGGVTMVDLYAVAAALDVPVHHNFSTRTIQLGDKGYTGEMMKGKIYRHLAMSRGWRMDKDMERCNKMTPADNKRDIRRLFDDRP